MIINASLDTEADALYLQIRKGRVARTDELDSGTLVDVDAYGEPLGIEVIHPGREWPLREFIERYQVIGPLRDLLEQFVPSAASGRRQPFESQHPEVGTTAVAIAL